MNDNAYMEDVVKLLADSGRILFGERDLAELHAQEMLRLDEDELKALSKDEKESK